MTSEVLSFTQVAAIIAFIIALFVLYRLLVGKKDATIELLKEKLAAAKETNPDILAEKLSQRVKLLHEELSRLSKDQDKNKQLIHRKEVEIQRVQKELTQLNAQMERAKELMSEYFCPHCKAPMIDRECHSESVEYNGRDVDLDHTFEEFECGLTVVDGEEQSPCRNRSS